jgi:hypothetical protein
LPDFVDLGAAWSFDLYRGPLSLADQSARAIGDVTEIRPLFASASDSPTSCHTLLVSSILVDQGNRGTEFDDGTGKLRHVDNFRTREFVFKFGNARLIDFLLRFGSLIFRILGQIYIVGDGLLDPLNEASPLNPNAWGT